MVIFPWQVWQKEGRLYCDADYKKKFVPRCADCSGFILGVRQRQGFEIELCRIQMKTVDSFKILPPHGYYLTLMMETVKLVTGVYPSPGGNLAPRTLFLFCEFCTILSFKDYILLLLRVARRVWQRGQDSMNTRAGKACFCMQWTKSFKIYPVCSCLDIFRYS